MGTTDLFEEDLLDLIFDNIADQKGPSITASRAQLDGTMKEIEILGINSHGEVIRSDQPATIENISMIELCVETKSVINCRPGDVITLTDGGKSTNYNITSMSTSGKQTKMELVPNNEAPTPILHVHQDDPELEETTLDIDVELGLSPEET